MIWAGMRTRVKAALIVMGVTALHVVLLGWALSSNISPNTFSTSETIQVEFAERIPEISSTPELADFPDRSIEPVTPRPQPVKQAAPRKADGAVSGVTPGTDQPRVLSQNAPSDGDIASPSDGDPNGRLSEAQVAQVFKQLNCQKLRDHRRTDCPEKDPFTATILAEERREVAPQVWADSSYINRPIIEQFFKREADARLNWPDADLFTDPMAAGAYDAQRIRDAREPLWREEMRDGFRKGD